MLDSVTSRTPKTEGRERSGLSLRYYFWAIALALFTAGLLRQFLFQSYVIHSRSMAPSLLVGDYILMNKAAYGIRSPFERALWSTFSSPAVNDVIVFSRFTEEPLGVAHPHYVKRVVGVPGDTVEVREFQTFVNSEKVPSMGNEDWRDIVLRDPEMRNYGPRLLRDDEYFVLGDNRSNSRDSRYYGPVSMADIEGRAVLIFWSSAADAPGSPGNPVSSVSSGMGGLRWSRIGRRIH